MYNTKVLLALAALADASLAQTFPGPGCSKSLNDLVLAAPAVPADLQSNFGLQTPGASDASGAPTVNDLLSNPDMYVERVCSAAGSLPSSQVPEFASWASSLLHFASTEISSYDAVVTSCIATGTAAASITSYIHSIVSAPGALCPPASTSTPGGGNGTASITPYPTATPSGNDTSPGTPVPTTSVPTAGASRPAGAFIGAAALAGLLGAVALL